MSDAAQRAIDALAAVADIILPPPADAIVRLALGVVGALLGAADPRGAVERLALVCPSAAVIPLRAAAIKALDRAKV